MGVLDKFFGNSGKKEEDKVVLFVSLMMATAAADGNQSVEEGDYISDYISRASTDITEQKWKRIISKAESLEDKAIKTAIKLDKDEKVELVKELIGVAASDGHFHGAEFGWIVIFSQTIGLDSDYILTLLEKYDIDQNEISKSIEDFKEHAMEVKDQELEDDWHNFTSSPEKQNETDWAINKKAIHDEIDRINKSEDELSEENTDKEKVRKLFNSDKKTQAFIISMYNISILSPPIDELTDGSIELSFDNGSDNTEFMIETAKELQLHNFKDNFLKIMEIAGEKETPLQLGNTPPFLSLLKEYEKTMKTLSLEECEVLLFNLIKLSLLDKKLTNAEVHKINYVNSLFKSPIEATLNKMFSEISNIYQNKDDTDYIYFRSPMDIFNEAQKKSLLGEINDELMLYNALISQLNKKLFFGKLTENKFYTEGSELLPLGNIYFNRGQTYTRLDKKKEALKDYIKATEIYPETDNPLPFHHAGCMTFELGDHTKCIDFYNKALDINTEESIDSYYMRGLAYLSEKCKKKSIKQAKSDLEKYLKHNPSDTSALNLMEAVKIGEYIKIEKNIVVDNEQNEPADQLEIVKTFYDDGTLLQEYQINTKQEKDGYHRIYYPNGQLKVESIWTNGLQDDGDVISYHDDGSKARQVTLVDHLMNGNYFEWYKNGQLKTQGIYNDKIPTILKQWDENGTSKKVNTAPKPKLTPPPVKDSFEAKEDLIIQEITEAPVINKEENKEKVKEVETIAEKEIQKKNNSKRLYLIIFCIVGVIGIFFISKSISKIYLGSSQNQSSKNKTLDVPNGNTYLYNRHQEFNITLPGEVYYESDENQESLSNENFVAYLSVYTAGNGYEYISDFTKELNEFAEDYGYTEIRKFTKGSISSEISYEFYSGYSPDDRCTVIFGVIQNSFSRKLYDFNLICLKIDLKTATSIINSIEIK